MLKTIILIEEFLLLIRINCDLLPSVFKSVQKLDKLNGLAIWDVLEERVECVGIQIHGSNSTARGCY